MCIHIPFKCNGLKKLKWVWGKRSEIFCPWKSSFMKDWNQIKYMLLCELYIKTKLKLLAVIKYCGSRFTCAGLIFRSLCIVHLFLRSTRRQIQALLLWVPRRHDSVLVEMEREVNALCYGVSKFSSLEPGGTFLPLIGSKARASSHRNTAMQAALCPFRGFAETQGSKSQMSLSSFGSFSASGAATLRTPDCSSALGLYVPSVCLFFFTTQNSQARTAKTMARTPKVTVGATIAAMFGPTVVLLECVTLATVVLFPHAGLLLSISSKTLPTTAPGMTGTSGDAAISSRDRQGQVRADWGLGASAWGHFIESSGHCEDLLHSLSSWWYIMIFDVAVLRWSK